VTAHPTGGALEASAPTRIDLAGGTIDIWPLYLFHERVETINAAISLRAHARVEARRDGRVLIHSLDTGRRLDGASGADLVRQDPSSLLARIVRHFEVESLTLTTRAESPAGAGIAGSSALNIAVCGALAHWTNHPCSDEQLLAIARDVEAQAIAVPTGWQDYYPALYGGVAAHEFGVGPPRRVALDVAPAELAERIVLAYTGEPRASGTNNWEVTKRHIDGDRDVHAAFERIAETARAMRQALAARDWDEVGRQLAAEWENRKRLAPGVTTPAIDDLVAIAQQAGARSAKVCGAGGGGCVMFFTQPARAGRVKDALRFAGARVMDYRIEIEGLRIVEPAATPPAP
jgi:D-glycero-alpha-D-manno-heptose-7-phosphate kinase